MIINIIMMRRYYYIQDDEEDTFLEHRLPCLLTGRKEMISQQQQQQKFFGFHRRVKHTCSVLGISLFKKKRMTMMRCTSRPTGKTISSSPTTPSH
jgi:hypothetical protein